MVDIAMLSSKKDLSEDDCPISHSFLSKRKIENDEIPKKIVSLTVLKRMKVSVTSLG